MKVYVALAVAEDEWEVIGVFANRELAERTVEKWMKGPINVLFDKARKTDFCRFDPRDYEITEHEIHEEEQ